MLNFLKLPTANQQVVPVLVLCCISLLVCLGGDSLVVHFDYARQFIIQGELWRLLTAHLFHTNTNHLMLNLAGLGLLWALHGEYYSYFRIGAVYLITGLCIAIGIYMFTPELNRYVGLSGVLHGLFVWGACEDIRSGRKTGWLMLLGVGLKVLHEQIQGPDAELGAWINAKVAIDAHLYGAVSGALAYLFTHVTDSLRKRKTAS